MCIKGYDFEKGGIKYKVISLDEKMVEVTYDHEEGVWPYGGYYGDIIVPPEVTYNNITFKVIRIGYSAFARSNINSVSISEGISEIASSAFYGCGVLNIYLPNSITNIGTDAFRGVRNLKYIRIPDRVKEIGSSAFEYAESLETIDLPIHLEKISSFCFKGCKELKEIEFPSEVYEIGYEAFQGCYNLSSITFPHSIKTIGMESFSGCSQVKEIHIFNSGVRCISDAFENCSNLQYVHVYDTEAHDADLDFPVNLIFFGTLYVPIGTAESYKNAKGWKNFTNIVEFNASDITNINQERKIKEQVYYDINGISNTSPNKKGIYITKGKKILY